MTHDGWPENSVNCPNTFSCHSSPVTCHSKACPKLKSVGSGSPTTASSCRSTRNTSVGNGFFFSAKNVMTSGRRCRNHHWKIGWSCWMRCGASFHAAATTPRTRNISAGGFESGFPRREFDGVPLLVCTVQNQANQGHDPDNQTQDDHNAQSIGFSFVSVVARNDGVQQVVDAAPMNLSYVKLHTVFSARIGPSREAQTMAF